MLLKTINSFDIRFLQKLFLGITAALVIFISYNIYTIERNEHQYLFGNFTGNEDLSAIELENILVYSDDSGGSGIRYNTKNRIFEYSE